MWKRGKGCGKIRDERKVRGWKTTLERQLGRGRCVEMKAGLKEAGRELKWEGRQGFTQTHLCWKITASESERKEKQRRREEGP